MFNWVLRKLGVKGKAATIAGAGLDAVGNAVTGGAIDKVDDAVRAAKSGDVIGAASEAAAVVKQAKGKKRDLYT